MKITRRGFIKWCAVSASALSLSSFDVNRLENIIFAAESSPSILWLQGSGCSGCSISLMNSIEQTTIDDLLINKVNMKYHHNLMIAAGDLALSVIDQTMSQLNGEFILVIEGAVPTANNGTYCILTEKDGKPWTMLDAVKEIGPQAKYVINVGTCAAFGGVPMAEPNVTGIKRIDEEILKGKTINPIINLPGCPVHPLTLTKTIIDLILYGLPKLDKEGRPLEFYQYKVHDKCLYKGANKAKELGMAGCYNSLGCRGPNANYDCPNRKWNNKVNWCIEAGHLCISCSDKNFPKTPFYNFK